MVGLWTIQLLVQMHRHWVQFCTPNCHNKPHIGNGAGVWMTSCLEAMVLRIWRFWKKSQFGVDCRPGRRQFCLCHGFESWKVDFGLSVIEADGWEVELRPWCWEVGVRPVWYERLLRIVSLSLSLLVSKKVQKFNKHSYLNNGVACVFVLQLYNSRMCWFAANIHNLIFVISSVTTQTLSSHQKIIQEWKVHL